MYLNYEVYLEVWLDSFIFCITLEKLLVRCFSCHKFLLLLSLWSFINNHWAKIPGIPAAIRMSSQLHDQVVYSYETNVFVMRKGFALTFPSTAYNVFRFCESRLCWLLNTTLGDSWHDQQSDKDVPVPNTTFLLGAQFQGPKLQLQRMVSLPKEGGRERTAGYKEMLAYCLSFNPRAKSWIQEGTYIK